MTVNVRPRINGAMKYQPKGTLYMLDGCGYYVKYEDYEELAAAYYGRAGENFKHGAKFTRLAIQLKNVREKVRKAKRTDVYNSTGDNIIASGEKLCVMRQPEWQAILDAVGEE